MKTFLGSDSGSCLLRWVRECCGKILVQWETPAVQSTNRNSALAVLLVFATAGMYWFKRQPECSAYLVLWTIERSKMM